MIQVASSFINLPLAELNRGIQSSMAEIGEYLGVDRFYIFDYDWQQNTCSNTFEWCATGIEPQIRYLQKTSLHEIPDWVNAHRSGNPFIVIDINKLPPGGVRDILEPQNIKSLITVPIMDEDICIGFIGIDSVKTRHEYTDDERYLLQLFADVILNVRRREKMMHELENALNETKASREELREREEILRKLTETQTNYVLRTDLAGKHTYWNHKFEEEFAWLYPNGTLKEQDSLASICEYHHERTREAVEKSLAEPGRIVKVHLDKPSQHGGIRSTLWDFVCLLDDKGNPSEIQCMGIDISEQIASYKKLEIFHKRAEALLRLPAALESLGEKEFMQHAQELAEDLTDSSIAFIHFVNNDEETIELVTWSKRTLELYCHAAYDSHYPVSKAGIWADALRKRAPVVINDYAAYPAKKGLPEGHSHLVRFISVPVIENGKVVMLTGVGNKKDDYTELDVETVQSISNNIWTLIQRKRGQKILHEKETRFRQAAEHSRSVIWEIEPDGLYTYVSSSSLIVYGYTPEELVGKKYFFELFPEPVRDKYRQRHIDLFRIDKSNTHLDNPVITKSGEIIWVSTNGKTLYDEDGNISRYRGVDVEITERKLAENESRKFRAVSDQANFGNAIASLDGFLIYVNNTFAEMHGFTQKELIGKNLSILHTVKEFQVQGAMYNHLLQEGHQTAIEIWRKRKDGSVFPALMNAVIVFDNNNRPEFLSASVIDITERKQQEAEIKKLRMAIEQSPVAILVTDLEAKIQYTNPAFTTMTGYELAEIFGTKASVLASGKTAPEIYQNLWKTIQLRQTWSGEWQNRKKNGELYWEKCIISPVNDERNHVTGYLAIKEDLTERKRAEKDRIDRQAAEQANHTKSTFLANMSHEIRTPLNAIIGFAQILIKDRALAEIQHDQIQTILNSGRHLLSIINDILDLSKIEAGRNSINKNDFNLLSLLDEIQIMFSLKAEEKGLYLEDEIASDFPELVHSDEGKVRQILLNLIGNAVKFTDEGAIRIICGTQYSNDENDKLNSIVIQVQDTGCGIADDELDRIFDAFGQGTNIKTGGTGLGLTISRLLAELLGGGISVQSVKGEGSTFSLTLPFEEPHNKNADKSDPLYSITGIEVPENGSRLLVVDDNAENLNLLKLILSDYGFTVTTCNNGKNALEKFAKESFDAVIMDLKMPVMDGWQATKIIKSTEEGKNIPVIAVTASVFEDNRSLLDSGFAAYIHKPFEVENILLKLSQNLNLKLKYGYPSSANQASEPTRPALLNSADLQAISDDLKERMRSAVEIGNMTLFRNLLADSKLNDTLVKSLLLLARNYEYDKLHTLLQ